MSVSPGCAFVSVISANSIPSFDVKMKTSVSAMGFPAPFSAKVPEKPVPARSGRGRKESGRKKGARLLNFALALLHIPITELPVDGARCMVATARRVRSG